MYKDELCCYTWAIWLMATLAPVDSTAAAVAQQRSYRLFPFAHTQKITEPIRCDEDGTLLMIELPFSVFLPGAQAWSHILMLSDRIQLVRLWFFFLQCACECRARVILETVVDGPEYKNTFNSTLSQDITVVAYRLWIPLDTNNEQTFLSVVASALTSNRAADSVLTQPSSQHKRRKTDSSETISVPDYLENIVKQSDLEKCTSLYYMGKRRCPVTMVVDTTMSGMDGPSSGTLLTKYFEASSQFLDPDFIRRYGDGSVLQEQRTIDSYLITTPTGAKAFFPTEYLRNKGLIRVFDTGHDAAFIMDAFDLFRYMLPQKVATIDEIRHKIDLVESARGTIRDLSNVPLAELMEMTGDGTFTSRDPYYYSPMTISSDIDPSKNQTSFYETARDRQYPVIASLKTRNQHRRHHASRGKDPARVYQVFKTTLKEMEMMLRAPKLDGVPPVYNDLCNAADEYMHYMRSTTNKDAHDQRVRRWFNGENIVNKDEYHGLCSMLTTLTVSANQRLGLTGTQRGTWLLIYLQTYTTTLNRMGESFFGLLSGRHDTGKSHACKTMLDCIPPKLVFQSDATSALAITVYGPEQDMRVTYIDELKTLSDSKTGSTDVTTKLVQSQLSCGVITYSVKTFDKLTGRWVFTMSVVVLRTCVIGCTNFAHMVSEALQSRATNFVAAPSPTDTDQSTIKSRNDHVSERDSQIVQLMYNSFCRLLQTYSSLAYRYTAMEAVGVIPPMEDSMFILFNNLLFARFGSDIMAGRRIVALRKLAESIRIFDLITTWYTRGLGKLFGNDGTAEIMYYACASYLTAPSIVAAFALLEQSTSTDLQLKRMESILKDTISIENGTPVTDGDTYYVSVFSRRGDVLKHLKKYMGDLGDGVIRKLYGVIENGVSSDNLPYIIEQRVGTNERLMYHRTWMGTIRTPTEKAIVDVLARYQNTNSCRPGYVNESTIRVFHNEIHRSLYDVEDPHAKIKHKELHSKSKSHVKQALAYLQDARNNEGTPLFSIIMEHVDTAMYTEKDTDVAEPSSIHPGKYKVRGSWSGAIVTHVDLFQKEDTGSAMDTFFMDYLSIAGGYNDGRRIYVGMNMRAKDGTALPVHTIRIPSTHTVNVTLPNKHYKSPTEKFILGDDDDILGEESEFADAKSLHHDIFNPEHEHITYTHESGIEMKVAQYALDRINPGPVYSDAFLSAMLRF